MDTNTHFEIEQLLKSYATYADTGDPDAIVAMYSSDAVLVSNGREVPSEKFPKFYSSLRGQPPFQTHHVLTNIVVSDGADGRVSAVTYFHVFRGAGLTVWGRYLDDFARIDGAWKITRREVAIDGPKQD